MIRIVTDSTCDLPEELIEKHHITVVPMLIHVGSQTYRDGLDLSRESFYQQLPNFKSAPTTAAPGPEAFHQVYDRLISEGASEILSIHISTRLSSVYEMARQGAAATTSAPVSAFDSRQLSLGTGFQVLAAAQAAEVGLPMHDILAMLENQIKRTHVFAALDTLEFMRRSGRMNAAISFIGGLLQIKPILKMVDGQPSAERVRTRNTAMTRLVELLYEAAPFEKVALLHSGASDRALALLDEVRQLFPAGKMMIEEINPVLGAHIGPNVIGFACISRA